MASKTNKTKIKESTKSTYNYGDEVKDASGKVIGTAKFNDKTGEALRPITTPEPAPAPKTKTNVSTTPRVVYDDEPDLITAKSVDEIQQEKLKGAQAEISSLNDYYATLTNESKILGEKNMRSTDSISVLTGLQGSTEASEAAKTTGAANKRDLDRIANEKNMAIQALLGKIRTSAVEEAKQMRLEARQSEQDRISFREKAKAEAVENLTALSKSESGATLEGLKATLDPKTYETYIKNIGGEEIAKAILFENRPKNTVLGSPQLIGGKMVQAYTKPDGTVKYETIDLPAGVTPDKIKSIEKTDNGIFIINNDGTYSRISGSGKIDGSGGAGTGVGALGEFPADIQAAAQSIFDGKSKLNEYPSAKRLQINQAMSKLYTAEGGNELAQGAYDAIVAIENHPGFKGAIGAKGPSSLFGLKDKPIAGTDAAGFVKQLDTLKANIKLVNIKYLKGTGALSDAEGKTLEDAGTSLDPSLPEADFKKELARVKAALLKANNVKTVDQGNVTESGDALDPALDPLGLFP